MSQFIPGIPEEAEAIRAQWNQYLMLCGAPLSSRAVYRLEYYHDGSRIIATVGKRRSVFHLKHGPTGGHITNGEHHENGIASGEMIACMVDTGERLFVFMCENSNDWENPSMVGHSYRNEIKYF